MELLVLGNGAAYPGPNQACTGYLVKDNGNALMIDCGNGVVSRLMESGEAENIAALLFTHLHADHCLDIFSLFYSRIYGKHKYPRLPLYLPPGEADRLRMLAEVLRVEPKKLFEQAFEPIEYDPEGVLSAAGFQIRFAANQHPVPTFAVRVEYDGRSMVYSSDTGPDGDLEKLVRGCDLLLCEATTAVQDFNPERKIHLTPQMAAEIASRGGVKRLLLTHIWEYYDREAMLRDAQAVFPGAELAEELRRYPV